MKRARLIRQIRDAARTAGIPFERVRQGSEHEIWRCGRSHVVIPRHREINDRTALRIRQYLESELGKDWWR